ncbi:MAG: glutamine--scyllo-inositol aminotransferase [Leifsonia xyli]|nr:MAG: glutamine--scyllo-inositol aminotransferase [Leifsonia xyli]
MRLNVPLLGSAEAEAVARVLESGYLTQGAEAAAFEQLITAKVGVPYGFATSSATTGLHLALVALGVGPGDEVIIPDFSFPATANVVVQQGATPVFVDIRLDDFGLAPESLEAAITARTKAIMPVHAFGLVADMEPIMQIAARHGIPVLEDAACALGAEYRGRQAGSWGDAGVFSFHPRKVITTAEGGMITTADERLAEKVRVLRSHGAVRGAHYMSFVEAGFNYRLSDVHAAIGVAQFAKLDVILEGRSRLAAQYAPRLAAVEGARPPIVPEGRTHTYQSYVVLLDPEVDRDGVIEFMRNDGIETTLGTYGLHLQPYFRERFGLPDGDFPGATRAHQSALTLPLHLEMDADDVERVVLSLKRAIDTHRH